MSIVTIYRQANPVSIERWSLYKGLKYIAGIILRYVIQVVIIERQSYYKEVSLDKFHCNDCISSYGMNKGLSL